MAQSNIDIKIIAEFLGKSAFKQADTAANKLNKTVKSLGQSFGLAFGGAALGYAIKSTIKDFADAQRETQQLTNTVKNLGLAFAAPEINAYIEKIGKLYGVTGDQAVPAMQALLTATGSVSRSTKIMNVALDLAASRSADVASVAKDLSSAYVGNTKGLNQYKLGLTKAELAAMSFDEILEKISSQTLGAADEAAKTLTGQLAILSEISNQAKERIGGGLVEVLGGLAGPDGAGGAAKTIENLSIKLTNAITGFGYLVKEVKIAAPILAAAGVAVGLAWAPWFTAIAAATLAIGAIGNAMKKDMPKTPLNTGNLFNQGKLFFPTGGDAGYSERLKAQAKAEKDSIARAKALALLVKNQAASQAKILKDKKLAAAIDKANAALGKGVDVFDIDQIQIGAALTNQAEQLAKSTSGAQVLQIANDTARLNVKRAILDLENAIAAGDTVAIEKAVARLGKELSILNALDAQVVKLKDIKLVLDSLSSKVVGVNVDTTEALNKIKALYASASASIVLPVDTTDAANKIKALFTNPAITLLVNTQTEEAINKIKELYASAAQGIVIPVSLSGTATSTDTTTGLPGAPINIGGLFTAIGSNFKEYLVETGAFTSGIKPNGGEFNYNISVNTGIGDPAAIANTIVEFLNAAKANGTLANGILNPI
jgi:hypothetical protein